MAARSCTTQRQRPNIDPQIPILNVRAGHEAIARIRCKANAACLTLRPPSPPMARPPIGIIGWPTPGLGEILRICTAVTGAVTRGARSDL